MKNNFKLNIIMSLYIGKNRSFRSSDRIKCYKVLKDGDKTLTRGWPIRWATEEGEKTILTPDEGEAEITQIGSAWSVESGTIHAFLFPPGDLKDDEVCYIGWIPEDTEFWVQSDLTQVAAREMELTQSTPDEAELESNLFDPDGEFAKTNTFQVYCYSDGDGFTSHPVLPTEDYEKEEVIGIIVPSGKIMALEIGQEFCISDSDPTSEISTATRDYTKALQDKKGKENTLALGERVDYGWNGINWIKNFKTPGTAEGDWYLPALGELKEDIMECQLEINLTRKYLGLPILPTGWYWSSSMYDKDQGWGFSGNGSWSWFVQTWYRCIGNLVALSKQ